MHRSLTTFALAALAACGGGATAPSAPAGSAADGTARGVRYETDRAAYTPADTIVSRLVNHSARDAGYNLCVSVLERRSGERWTAVARNPERPCIMPLYVLRPGESASFRETAGAVPGPGTYRLRTTVEAPLHESSRAVVTEPFTVGR